MKKAFTLIELLIVVAIIAILAAIAVPNFLEAQVRAKVSRAKADMRTVALAIEAKRVNTNKTPYDSGEIRMMNAGEEVPESVLFGDPPFGLTPEVVLGQLTTPVSYIGELPVNPFTAIGGETTVGDVYNIEEIPIPMYSYMALHNEPAECSIHERWPDPSAEYSRRPVEACWWRGIDWFLWCFGPSRTNVRYDLGPSHGMWPPRVTAHMYIPIYLYDPTNGTTSLGLILRNPLGEMTGDKVIYKSQDEYEPWPPE